MMNNTLTVKGRDDVRYILTEAAVCGSSLVPAEGVAVYSSGLQLMVKTENCSDSAYRLLVKTIAELNGEGFEIHPCFCFDELMADRRKGVLRSVGLSGCSFVSGAVGAAIAHKYSKMVLTLPECDSGGFFTLYSVGRAEGADKLIIGCNKRELRQALEAAASASEGSGSK